MTNYKQPHKFEDSGGMSGGQRICDHCGFAEGFGDIHPVGDQRIQEIVEEFECLLEELVSPPKEEFFKLSDWLKSTLEKYGVEEYVKGYQHGSGNVLSEKQMRKLTESITTKEE